MGKWAEVHCNCINRTPVPNSDFLFGKPHRHKRRLTKMEKQEADEWERTTKNMYECGHRGGALIELCPGAIIRLGDVIGHIFPDTGNTFEIFTRVGYWRCYEDELLLITPDEASLWLLEIDEIQRAIHGLGNLAVKRMEKLLLEFHREELGMSVELEKRLDKAAKEMPFSPVVGIKRNVQQSRRPDIESTSEKIIKALTDAAILCQASIRTGNPIRLLW